MSRRATADLSAVAWAKADNGVALLIVMVLMSMLLALGLTLTSVTMTESAIAGGFAEASRLLYAAESAVESALPALQQENWSTLLGGRPSVRYRRALLSELFPPTLAAPPLAIEVWIAPVAGNPDRLVVTGSAATASGGRAVEVHALRVGGEPDLRVVSWREVR